MDSVELEKTNTNNQYKTTTDLILVSINVFCLLKSYISIAAVSYSPLLLLGIV